MDLINILCSDVPFQEEIIFYFLKILLREYKEKNLVLKASSAKLHVQRALICKRVRTRLLQTIHSCSKSNCIYICIYLFNNSIFIIFMEIFLQMINKELQRRKSDCFQKWWFTRTKYNEKNNININYQL